jgi:hypothetical protein
MRRSSPNYWEVYLTFQKVILYVNFGVPDRLRILEENA